MISTVPQVSLSYNSVKYKTFEDKALAIYAKNGNARRDSEGSREYVWYPNNSPYLCWINRETDCFASHWHPALEIIMPLDNIYTVKLDGQTIVLNEGDIFVIPAGALHELCAPATGARIFLLARYTTLSTLSGFSVLSSRLITPLLITTSARGYEQCRDILLSIVNLYADDESFWELSVNAMLIHFMILLNQIHIYSNNMLPQQSSSKQKEYIQKFNAVFTYIDQNYMEDLDLETVANAAGFSKFHFSRLFRQFTNTSFNEYLNNRRIQAAIALLSSSELPITEIALMSGFSSISTFNRVFRSIKKCTPTEFKKYQV